jgi:hypothetical protein
MDVILVIGFLLVILTAVMLSRRPHRPPAAPTRLKSAPPYPGALFGAEVSPESAPADESGAEESAGAVVDDWREALARGSAAEALQRAARAGDAGVYREAIEAALAAWRGGQLPQLPAARLCALIESHYWEIAPGAGGAGASYVLKRVIAEARRELAAAQRRAPN